VTARDRDRDRLTIHHKFRSNLAGYDKKRVAMAGWLRTSHAMAQGMRAWPCLHMARRALERPQRMGTSTADAAAARRAVDERAPPSS